MSKDIWQDCKNQPPLIDDGELVLMDSNDKFWVGFCEITSDGVSYFANNAEPLKNDFVKYARIEKLLALETENKDLSDKIGKLETELERTRKALEIAVDAIKNATEYLGNQEPLVDVMAMNLHTDCRNRNRKSRTGIHTICGLGD